MSGDCLRRGVTKRTGSDHRLPAGDVATPITRSPSRHPPHIQFLSLPSKNFTTARVRKSNAERRRTGRTAIIIILRKRRSINILKRNVNSPLPFKCKIQFHLITWKTKAKLFVLVRCDGDVVTFIINVCYTLNRNVIVC